MTAILRRRAAALVLLFMPSTHLHVVLSLDVYSLVRSRLPRLGLECTASVDFLITHFSIFSYDVVYDLWSQSS
ncbi:hypothetical protein GQ53DRAFT_525696 [Thozetella sp. PMI_491]|nr:hypothetical protein GQ53DRAFT_525696 [Thozetella sp. PMI_491]